MPDLVQAHVAFEIAKANLERAQKAEKAAREKERLERVESRKNGGSSFYVAFGERIRQRRVCLELTQQALAHEVGLTRQSINNIEAGRQRVLLDRLVLFAEALACMPSDLVPDE